MLSLDLLRRRLIAQWLRLAPPECSVRLERNIPIPMADGIVLLADHYTPQSRLRLPTILIRSPWGRGWEQAPFSVLYMFICQRLAERGYHVILQDLRDQSSTPEQGWFAGQVEDGRATLEWIGRQPWFNGCLGMWGASILGYMQWAAAVDAPPFLRALVPVTTASQWFTLVYPDGAFALDTMLRLAMMVNTAGKSIRELLSGGKKQAVALAAALQHLPLCEADRVLLGKPDPSFQNWLAHPHRSDAFWQASDHSASVPRTSAAVNLVAGWHDIFLRAQLEDYAALKAAGRSPYLTIGPWHHSHPDLGMASLREALTWFEAHLKGQARRLRTLPVHLFVSGANEWRDFPDWPPESHAMCYFLQAQGQLSTEPAAPGTEADLFRYDPTDPTPSVGGPSLEPAAAGAQDNRRLESRPDVLCYTSRVLAGDVDVIGAAHLDLYVSSTLAHADFFGRICDLQPDGRSTNVCDGLFRIEPGKGDPQPDGSRQIRIDLLPTAYRYRTGHSIRVQVSSGAHPRWSRNLGTGEPLSTGRRMQAARQTVYHDREHPSMLILPVVS